MLVTVIFDIPDDAPHYASRLKEAALRAALRDAIKCNNAIIQQVAQKWLKEHVERLLVLDDELIDEYGQF